MLDEYACWKLTINYILSFIFPSRLACVASVSNRVDALLQDCGGVLSSGPVKTRTPDLEVPGSSLARRVVSLDKELYSSLSLFTQVYKWVPATYCWRVTLRWTIASRPRENSNTLRHALC